VPIFAHFKIFKRKRGLPIFQLEKITGISRTTISKHYINMQKHKKQACPYYS